MEEQIVCRDRFSNFPESIKQIPAVKGHDKVDPNELREFEPDLVFTETVVQEKLADYLRSHDFQVVHQDPRTLNEVYESIRALGTMFQLEEKAEELVLQMQQGFKDVKRRAGLLGQRPRVYIEEWPATADKCDPFVSGNWVPDIVQMAGLTSFPIQSGSLSKEVTLEEVKQFDPDFIVISWCGAGTLADPELLTSRSGWSSLRAIEQGNVRVIDDSFLNRPGPRLVEGARRLYGWGFEILH